MEIAACLINITDISNKETSKTKPRQEKVTVREEHQEMAKENEKLQHVT